MTIYARLVSDRKIQLPECVIQKMDLSVNDEIIVQIEDNKLILTKKKKIRQIFLMDHMKTSGTILMAKSI